MLDSWDSFHLTRKALLDKGQYLADTKTIHRLWYDRTSVDLIPFGKIESKGYQINWPPEFAFTINLIGFMEAYQNAVDVEIFKKRIKVVTVESLVSLKILSWNDAPNRQRDGADLLFLLKRYSEFYPAALDEIYDPDFEPLLVAAGHDPSFSSVSLLGKRIKSKATRNLLASLIFVLEKETREEGTLRLVGAMVGDTTIAATAERTEFSLGLLQALLKRP